MAHAMPVPSTVEVERPSSSMITRLLQETPLMLVASGGC